MKSTRRSFGEVDCSLKPCRLIFTTLKLKHREASNSELTFELSKREGPSPLGKSTFPKDSEASITEHISIVCKAFQFDVRTIMAYDGTANKMLDCSLLSYRYCPLSNEKDRTITSAAVTVPSTNRYCLSSVSFFMVCTGAAMGMEKTRHLDHNN